MYVAYGVTTVARGTGGHTNGIFLVDSGGTTWLVTGGYSSVAVVDIDPNSPTYNQEIAMIRVPAGAQDVALSGAGIAYVTSGDGKSVTVIDTATNAVIGTFTTDDTATTVRSVGFWGDSYSTRLATMDDNGNLYVTDTTDGTLYVVDVDIASTALATRL